MLHKRRKAKLARNHSHRSSLIRNLVKSLINHERIRTTKTKAKAIRPIIEKIITIGKKMTLCSRRNIISRIGSSGKEVKKVIDVISPRLLKRKGGYTRILKDGHRLGDFAPMAYIEIIRDKM